MKTKVDKVTGQPREDDVIQADPLSISLKRILTSQLTAIEDATDAASAITQLNLLLEAARIQGLILILSGELLNELTNIPAPTLCEIDTNFDISITWNDNTGTGTADANDIINFILFNVTTDIVKQFTATRETSALEILQTESGISENDEVALFYFASNAARTIFSNTASATLTEAAPEPQALEITLSTIYPPFLNLSFWNDTFILPTNGTPFSSIIIEGNKIKLFGGANIHVIDDFYFTNIYLITKIEDFAGCIISAGIGFGNAFESLTYLYLPSLLTTNYYSFCNTFLITDLILPKITTFTNVPGNDSSFSELSGATFNLTIPHATEFDPAIIAAKLYNTITIIYSD